MESLGGNRVKVSVDIDSDEFEEKLNKAFRKLAHEVRLPGFRPGKAPRRVLESRIGPQAARGEALNDAVPEYYSRAIQDHDVDVISSPEIDVTSGIEEGPVSFDAVVEIRPTVVVTGYDRLKAEVPSPEPTEEEIEQRIDQLRRQFGELASVARPAIDGDTVTMDVYGSHNGEQVEGLTADDYDYEVGSGGVVPEIDEQLRGAKVGDILEFNADHPQEDGLLRFRILVKKVQETILPDLDDEFVQEASEFDTVDELYADTTKNIAVVKRINASNSLAEQVGVQLAELVTDDIPEALVNPEVLELLRDFQLRLARQGVEVETYLETTGQTVGEMMDALREPALVKARTELALRAVIDAESIEASDEEVEFEMELLALETGQTVEELKSSVFADDESSLRGVTLSARIRKAREWVMDRVEITDAAGNRLERSSLNPRNYSEPSPTVSENDSESQTP